MTFLTLDIELDKRAGAFFAQRSAQRFNGEMLPVILGTKT